jgi:CheY-like chemotaxis protein
MTAKKHSIVLVDDDELVRDAISAQVKQWYDVDAFSSGAELLESLDNLNPSLFLIDWIMPGMDGLTLCLELRKEHRLDPVPVAFFTGVDPKIENIQLASRVGAQSFISKNSTPAFVLIQIHTLIDHYQRISDYLRDRKMMLSVLEHDIANLLTGVTTGVDILAMSPAFKNQELERQSIPILKAARELRELFLDLGEVLTFYSPERQEPGKPVQLQDILTDLRGYLANVTREIILRFPESLELVCVRRCLGRALFYQVRFIDNHLPLDQTVTLEAKKIKTGIIFTISVPGCFQAKWEKAFFGREEMAQNNARDDRLFVEYVRNVISLHQSELTVTEGNGKTELRFVIS